MVRFSDMTTSDPRPSLVFGIVAATGTHIDPFVDTFSALLRRYGYEPASVRLTDLLLDHAFEPDSLHWNDEGERIQKLMDAGDLLREKLDRGDAMALLGALGIAAKRRDLDQSKPCAFVIRQLKHPEEVSTLRQIYGDRLFVLALYSTYSKRLRHLTGLRNIKPDVAKDLMRRDEEDVRKPMGQRTRDTFELGRAVHAEMDAILSCARTGAATHGARLFSTTFPCHNCAKHLLDAGIVEVQYVEAYPKCMAFPLHSDAIYSGRRCRPWSRRGQQGGVQALRGDRPAALRRPLLPHAELGAPRQAKKEGGEDLLLGSRNSRTSGTSDEPSVDLERRAIEVLKIAIRRFS